MNRHIIKIARANFTTPGLPQLNVTDEEIQIASLPGLVAWFDPQTRFQSTDPIGLTDRANGYPLRQFSADAPVITTDINGQFTAQMQTSPATGYTIDLDDLHPTGSYTKVAVVQFDTIVNQDLISAKGNIARLRVDGGGRIEVVHDTVTAETTALLVDDTPYILMVCYNAATKSAVAYVNGVEHELTGGDLEPPLSSDKLSFGFAESAGSFFNGKMAYSFVFDRDYSDLGYEVYRNRILDILSAKYAITIT